MFDPAFIMHMGLHYFLYEVVIPLEIISNLMVSTHRHISTSLTYNIPHYYICNNIFICMRFVSPWDVP